MVQQREDRLAAEVVDIEARPALVLHRAEPAPPFELRLQAVGQLLVDRPGDLQQRRRRLHRDGIFLFKRTRQRLHGDRESYGKRLHGIDGAAVGANLHSHDVLVVGRADEQRQFLAAKLPAVDLDRGGGDRQRAGSLGRQPIVVLPTPAHRFRPLPVDDRDHVGIERLFARRNDLEIGGKRLQVGLARVFDVVERHAIYDRLALVDCRAFEFGDQLGRVVSPGRGQPRRRRREYEYAENDLPAVALHLRHQSLSTLSGR